MPVLPRPTRPTPRRLGELGLPVATVDREVVVTGVTLDSRGVQPGDLYAALPGARTHGARFAAQASRAGAVAVLTDPTGAVLSDGFGLPVVVVEDPRARLGAVCAQVYAAPRPTLLGITGTNGKTTVSYLLDAGLRAAGLRTGLIGTVEIRMMGEAVPSVRTTPEAPELHALLATMGERGVQAVAMEVSSHALALHRVDGLRFAVGAFTNLSRDHLDFHGGLAAYFEAKARLFDGRCDHEVVNLDDAYGRRLLRPTTIGVSAAGDPAAAWRARAVTVGPAGSEFVALGPAGLELPVAVALPGDFNVANALLALAVLGTAGIDPELAAAGFATCTVPGRLELVDEGQPFTALVDYAHTPEAVRTLLASLRAVTDRQLVVVLGCGGDRDPGKRAAMGEAASAADLFVLTDDNPRSEDPAAIRTAMLAGVPAGRRSHVLVVPGRRAAIAAAVQAAGAGDTVVLAGKGHERGQETAGVLSPFDDRVVLRELIGALVR